jgi:hypothetical protein
MIWQIRYESTNRSTKFIVPEHFWVQYKHRDYKYIEKIYKEIDMRRAFNL